MQNDSSRNSNRKRVKFRNKELSSGAKNFSWTIRLTLWTFVISVGLNLISANVLENSALIVSFILLVVIILIGIIFDMIGIAVASADETPFHAMASRKVYAAKHAIYLIRNANKVSSFCNDVIGDICSIVAGSASALILINIVGSGLHEGVFKAVNLVFGALVASLTIGGKALGKTFAIQKSNYVVFTVGAIIGFVLDKMNIAKSLKKSE